VKAPSRGFNTPRCTASSARPIQAAEVGVNETMRGLLLLGRMNGLVAA
jgi:hypothetical protein